MIYSRFKVSEEEEEEEASNDDEEYEEETPSSSCDNSDSDVKSLMHLDHGSIQNTDVMVLENEDDKSTGSAQSTSSSESNRYSINDEPITFEVSKSNWFNLIILQIFDSVFNIYYCFFVDYRMRHRTLK